MPHVPQLPQLPQLPPTKGIVSRGGEPSYSQPEPARSPFATTRADSTRDPARFGVLGRFQSHGGNIQALANANWYMKRGDRTAEALWAIGRDGRRELFAQLGVRDYEMESLDQNMVSIFEPVPPPPKKPRTGFSRFLDLIESPISRAASTAVKFPYEFIGGDATAEQFLLQTRALGRAEHWKNIARDPLSLVTDRFTDPMGRAQTSAEFRRQTGQDLPQDRGERGEVLSARFKERPLKEQLLAQAAVDPLTYFGIAGPLLAAKGAALTRGGLTAVGAGERTARFGSQITRTLLFPEEVPLRLAGKAVGGTLRGTARAVVGTGSVVGAVVSPNRAAFLRKFRRAAESSLRSEKLVSEGLPIPSDQLDAASKDWRVFSELRGYTDAEIATQARFLELVEEGISKFGLSREDLLNEMYNIQTRLRSQGVRVASVEELTGPEGSILMLPSFDELTGQGGSFQVRVRSAKTGKIHKRYLAPEPDELPITEGRRIRNRWHTLRREGDPKPPGEGLKAWIKERYLRWQEQVTDESAGMRMLASRVARGGAAVGEDLESALITRSGQSWAGVSRYKVVASAIDKVTPNLVASRGRAGAVEAIEDVLDSLHYQEILKMKGDARLLPGSPKGEEGLVAAGKDLRRELGLELFDEAKKGAEVVRDTYRTMLYENVSEGIVTRELADLFVEKYPWYNPLVYISHAGSGSAKASGLGLTKSGLQRLGDIGSEGAARRPTEVLAEMLVEHEVRISRNRLAKSLVDALKSDPESVVTRAKIARPVAKVDEQLIHRPAPDDDPGVLSFFENGKRQAYNVPDWVSREMVMMMNSQNPSNTMARAVRRLQGILKAGIVTYDPVFIAGNMVFDMLASFATRGVMPVPIIMRIFKTIVGMGDDATSRGFKLSGGHQKRFFGTEKAGRELAESVGLGEASWKTSFWRKVRDFLPDIGEATEQAPRQRLWETEMDKMLPGWREMDEMAVSRTWQAKSAAAQAVELTLNFARGGHLINVIDPYILYARASVGGSLQIARALGIGGGKIAGREVAPTALRISGLMGGQMGLTAYNMSYPEYFDIPADVRHTSMLVMFPWKKKDRFGRPQPNYLKGMPFLRELGPFIGGMTYVTEKLFSSDPSSFREFMLVQAAHVSPVGPYLPLPSVAEEIVEQLSNHDLFHNRPIVSADLRNLPPEQQAGPYTSLTAKAIGNLFNASPQRLDHASYSVLGGTAANITSATDWIANQFLPKTDPKIEQLVQQQKALATDQERQLFRAELDLNTRIALDKAIEKRKPGIPVLSSLERRFTPGRGGRLALLERERLGEPTGGDLGARIAEAEQSRQIVHGSEIRLAEMYRIPLLRGEPDTARRFRSGAAGIQAAAVARSRDADRRYGSFSTTEAAKSLYTDFWDNGTLPDYADLLPKDEFRAAQFQYFDAFRMATERNGVTLDFEALELLLASSEETWTPQVREFMDEISGVNNHADPLLNEYEDVRLMLRDINWWDYHNQVDLFNRYSKAAQDDYVSYIQARRSRFALTQWERTHDKATVTRVENLRKIVEKERNERVLQAPEIEAGLVKFWGRVPRTVGAKAAIARQLPPESQLLVLTKGPDGGRLSVAKELRALGSAGIVTLDDLLGTSFYVLSSILGVRPDVLRKWRLHDQVQGIIELLEPGRGPFLPANIDTSDGLR